MTEDVTDCPLCLREDRESIEDSVGKGVATKSAVANQLGMSVEEVYIHMKEHLAKGKIRKYTREVQTDLDDKYSKYDMLFNNLLKLDDVFGPLVEAAAVDPDNARVQPIVKLASEIRQSINDLARLKGEMASETQITIIHYNQLKAVVMSELCPRCKKRIIESLEDEAFEKKMKELMRV